MNSKKKKEIDWNSPKDYSKIENQIGCGYCKLENTCGLRGENRENLGVKGCKQFIHWSK